MIVNEHTQTALSQSTNVLFYTNTCRLQSAAWKNDNCHVVTWETEQVLHCLGLKTLRQM